jgi:outer membrane protein insertion porin family
MKKVFLFFLGVNILLITNQANSQTVKDTLPVATYGTAKDYEIGGIKVIGAQFTEQSAIIGVTGLQVGKKIKFPGPDVPKAIKSLWKLRLFDDVQVLKDNWGCNFL